MDLDAKITRLTVTLDREVNCFIKLYRGEDETPFKVQANFLQTILDNLIFLIEQKIKELQVDL